MVTEPGDPRSDGFRAGVMHNNYYGPVYFGHPTGPSTDPTVVSSAEQARTASTSLHRIEKALDRVRRESVDYAGLDQVIRQVRESSTDPAKVDELRSSIDSMKTQISEATQVANAGAVEITRLVVELQKADAKSRKLFWLGIVLGLPVGLLGSVIAWLIGIA